jgi:hypothetical protein
MGTGGFYLGADIELFEPLIQGETGIRSALRLQPKELPLYYEAMYHESTRICWTYRRNYFC